MIPKYTDRDFLWYRYGKYQEITTDTNQKILIRYTTLQFWPKVEVRSCRQIYVEMYEKKNNNLHLQKFTQTSL